MLERKVELLGLHNNIYVYLICVGYNPDRFFGVVRLAF